jgi:outer membrane lipopolysaccharide assembly protein LptE/RlpB
LPCENEKATLMRLLRIAPLVLLLSLAGCGYHTVGSAAHLPKTVHTLAIPIFANRTQSYHTEASFTGAVIREFNNRTPYHILNTAGTDADATLHGTITAYQVVPLTYNSQTGQSSSFLITIAARVTITDRDNRVLYSNPSLVFRQQYQTTENLVSFIQEDPAAVERLSRDFAQNLVGDILESF